MVQTTQTEATITLPPSLAEVANRLASEQHWTFDQAVLFLVKRGAKAQQEAEGRISTSYKRFMEADENAESEAGDELIRSVLGPQSVA